MRRFIHIVINESLINMMFYLCSIILMKCIIRVEWMLLWDEVWGKCVLGQVRIQPTDLRASSNDRFGSYRQSAAHAWAAPIECTYPTIAVKRVRFVQHFALRGFPHERLAASFSHRSRAFQPLSARAIRLVTLYNTESIICLTYRHMETLNTLHLFWPTGPESRNRTDSYILSRRS